MSAREQKSTAVNALAQLSFEAHRANAECVHAYRTKTIDKGNAEQWSNSVVDLQRWAISACIRYNIAAPSAFEGLGIETDAKRADLLQRRDELCADGRARFPAAALAEPAAKALFTVLLDIWRSRQETSDERDRVWQRMQAATDQACARFPALTPPVKSRGRPD